MLCVGCLAWKEPQRRVVAIEAPQCRNVPSEVIGVGRTSGCCNKERALCVKIGDEVEEPNSNTSFEFAERVCSSTVRDTRTRLHVASSPTE